MLYPILISYKYTYISHCELSHLHPLYVIHSFSAFCFFTQKNKGNFLFFFNLFQLETQLLKVGVLAYRLSLLRRTLQFLYFTITLIGLCGGDLCAIRRAGNLACVSCLCEFPECY